MSVNLREKNVGDVVKIKENGAAVNFIIVHKGKPSGLYDDSCDGVWLLREELHSNRVFHSNDKSVYENSDIDVWLNGEYLNSIDPSVRGLIKTVRIPFKKGNGKDASGVQTGSNGLQRRAFLLSAYEVGFVTLNNTPQLQFAVDGAKLDYFTDNNSRNCKNNAYWTRTPTADSDHHACLVGYAGDLSCFMVNCGEYVRPAFVLPGDLLVSSAGFVSINTPPVITSDKIGDLGTLTSGFACHYSVDDEDAESSVSVTLTLDGVLKSTFTAVKNKQYAYSVTGDDWLKITNGSHTFNISASDGEDTEESAATFTRDQRELFVALEAPFTADDKITACALTITGSVPADAICKFEVTNNALDDDPVWEDCTERIRAGFNYLFKNAAAKKGFAFSFRMRISRGVSGIGGYITKILGGFE